MGTLHAYGYGPADDPTARKRRAGEDDLLRQHLPVILANAEKILATPRFFYCQIATAFMSSLWLFGGGAPIPLGVLILVWEQGRMLYDCPACGFQLHAVSLSGSLFQEVGTVWGFCDGCRHKQTVRLVPCHGDMMAVGELLRIYRNEPLIVKGSQPRFDWKAGITGEFTPDRVIIPSVEPVDLRTVIVELRGSESESGWADGKLLPEPEPTAQTPQLVRRGFIHPIPLEKKRV